MPNQEDKPFQWREKYMEVIEKGAAYTKTLVVGQEVDLISGVYCRKGKVVKVTPSGVEVQTGVQQTDGTWNAHELMHFNKKGEGDEGTFEEGPWHITDPQCPYDYPITYYHPPRV